SFFFSSRRRHTRFSRDWSSDVCSSDLSQNSDGGWGIRKGATSDIDSTGPALLVVGGEGYAGKAIGFLRKNQAASGGFSSGFGSRSEERRVGKECRARWWAEQ